MKKLSLDKTYTMKDKGLTTKINEIVDWINAYEAEVKKEFSEICGTIKQTEACGDCLENHRPEVAVCGCSCHLGIDPACLDCREIKKLAKSRETEPTKGCCDHGKEVKCDCGCHEKEELNQAFANGIEELGSYGIDKPDHTHGEDEDRPAFLVDDKLKEAAKKVREAEGDKDNYEKVQKIRVWFNKNWGAIDWDKFATFLESIN